MKTIETQDNDVRKFCEWGGMAGPVALTSRDYRSFIATKRRRQLDYGFDSNDAALPNGLFDWQKNVVKWAVRRGRCALFQECGLGKTIQQLAWAEQIVLHTNKPVIVHTPVGVRHQTQKESEKFGIGVDVKIVDSSHDVITGINLCNYEKLHRIDTSAFVGVVLDESSILKSYTGSTKRALIKAYAQTPYRMACTATPAPNDHMELGNHADFLGVMPSSEMLSRWFINDTMKAGGYRLKHHARNDFWEWVSSWAVCVERPSDVGGDDDGFVLPDLHVLRHVVHADISSARDGFLFPVANISATSIHDIKRQTNELRCSKVRDIVDESGTPFLVWCDTNYEADMLLSMITEAVDVRGNDREDEKERKLLAFSNGEIGVLVTKPRIAGFGMNWQHCNQMAFAGMSYSFEQYYQAVRRCWRFGQSRNVTVNVVLADCETGIASAVAKKESDHRLMHAGMASAMKNEIAVDVRNDALIGRHSARDDITLPLWMKGRSNGSR